MTPAALNKALALASAAERAGRPSEAYDALLAAQDLAPRPHAGTEALLAFLRRFAPRTRHAEVDCLWQRALTEAWARPADLALTIGAYLALQPELAAALQQGVVTQNLALQLEADRLFHALLRNTVVADARWQCLLVALAAQAIAAGPQTPTPQLTETLALWAWLSERVALPAAATDDAAGEQALLAAAHGGLLPSVVALAHAALQAPLHLAAWSALLHCLPDHPLVNTLLRAPLREAELVAQWPAATVRDAAVAQHYEAAPYPRWRREPLGLPVNLPPVVAQKLATAALQRPRVLVAGCGTGQQLFVAHDSYPGAQLTALDISRRSLAYARRQCDEAGLAVAAWHYADLLDFHAPAPFAIVECMGVLHHLRQSAAGLRQLAMLTPPGGVLHAAVYSRRARASVTALRTQLLAQSHDLATLDVCSLRRDLLAGRYGPLEPAILHSVDFYSVSGCRDLLLNARERVYDLPEFVSEAKAAGFDWLALDVPNAVAAAASDHFRQPAASLSVMQWDVFERLKPDSFGGMFNSWFVRR